MTIIAVSKKNPNQTNKEKKNCDRVKSTCNCQANVSNHTSITQNLGEGM